MIQNRPAQVVVGYDGSDGATAAVEWAAAEAVRRHLPLLAMHVADYGWADGPGGYLPWQPELIQRAAQQVADEAVELARKVEPDVEVVAQAVIGNVARELIEASRTAALVVIGTHGHGEVVSAALGSVAYTVSGHARCPAVVVRGTYTGPPDKDRGVVVGVDGSDGSGACIGYAADVALATGAPLLIVSAYRSVATYPRPGSAIWALESDGKAEFDSRAEQAAEEIVTAAGSLAREGRAGLEVRTQVMDGAPPTSLALATAGRGLLVVGSRGRGGFEGLMLGSVSHSVLHIAPCPVVIIAADQADQR